MEDTTAATPEVNDQQAKAIIDALDPTTLAKLVEGKGLVLKPETDYKAEIENARKAADSEATKRNYTSIEQTIFESTGVAKREGEKVHDYQKRAFSENQEKVNKQKEEVSAETSEVVTTYQKMNEGLLKRISDMEKREKDREEQSFKDKASGLIEGAFSTIKLNVSDDQMADEREEKRIVFEAKYSPVKAGNGSIVWKNKEGEVLLSANGMPMTPEQIIKQNHPSWLAKEGITAGLGIKGKAEKPASMWGTNRAEINENLQKEADKRQIAITHPDMIKLRKEAYAANGITT